MQTFTSYSITATSNPKTKAATQPNAPSVVRWAALVTVYKAARRKGHNPTLAQAQAYWQKHNVPGAGPANEARWCAARGYVALHN